MKLLLIERESLQRDRLLRHFRKEDFFCDAATGYDEALHKIEIFQYDCILLDPHLPDGDGLQLIKFLRDDRRKTGVIIIAHGDAAGDKIAGLNAGADDYLTKPVNLPELTARVKALVRRMYNQGQRAIEIKCVNIDMDSRTACCCGHLIPLTRSQYNLFLLLAVNRNHTVPIQSIAEHLFDGPSENAPAPDYVYVHMKNLKRKLKEAGCADLIRTVYGIGYKLGEDDQ